MNEQLKKKLLSTVLLSPEQKLEVKARHLALRSKPIAFAILLMGVFITIWGIIYGF